MELLNNNQGWHDAGGQKVARYGDCWWGRVRL